MKKIMEKVNEFFDEYYKSFAENSDRSVFFTLIYTEKAADLAGSAVFLFRYENNIRLHHSRHPIPHCRQILYILRN